MGALGAPRRVEYTGDSLRIDGTPFFMLSGSVHYPRSHPSVWPVVFRAMRRDGLNTVDTYVFWNEHEAGPPSADGAVPADFDGPRDLVRFIRCAWLHHLNVVLRIGPYVCAEVNYGGFPWWLRDRRGGGAAADATPIRFRTFHPTFCAQVERWLHRLVEETLRPAQLFAPQGGPIILVQLENEYAMVAERYGAAGQQYLDWVASLQKGLGCGVPLIMCLGASASHSDAVIETINAFYAHQLVDQHRRQHAASRQPLLWTECWTGWYDVWGAPHHRRDARDLAYAVIRFWAAGGSGVNYYMYFGGTNLRRQNTMYLQATSYDYDAPLNEYAMETTKSRHLRRLHEALLPYVDPARGVLDVSRLHLEVEEDRRRVVVYERATRRLLFDTAEVRAVLRTELVLTRPVEYFEALARNRQWFMRHEAPRFERELPPGTCLAQLPDIVAASADSTDYAWYRLRCPEAVPGNSVLRLGVADYGQVWRQAVRQHKHGTAPQWVASGPNSPFEDRFVNDWNATEHGYGSIEIGEVCCECEYVVLVSSLGMVKGDWQLPPGGNMADERKALLWARYTTEPGGAERDALVTGFTVGLRGERDAGVLSGDADEFPLTWTSASRSSAGAPRAEAWPRWYRVALALPPPDAAENKGAVIDLDGTGLEKGWLYMNGHPCGRHWNIVGTAPKNGFLLQPSEDGRPAPVEQAPAGTPTQRKYYVPEWCLQPDGHDNVLVVFDEGGGRQLPLDLGRMRVYRAKMVVDKE